MRDRVPTKPNRYAVYDDAHNFLRYEYHERADKPTQVGDALNKANLLPDTVATALGLTGNPQVGDALNKIKVLIDGNAKIATGSYVGTGTYGSANPCSLTFDFVPKFVLVQCIYYSTGQAYLWAGLTASNGAGGAGYNGATRYDKTITTLSNQTQSWYNTANAAAQCNESGATYFYVAIG